MSMVTFLISLGYLGLFLSAWLAGSVIPFNSEVVFTGLLLTHHFNPVLLVLIGILGDWMGEMFNLWLGHKGKLEWTQRFLKLTPEKMQLWQGRLQKYGPFWTAFSFIPGVGNASVVLAGYFRCSVIKVAAYVLVGQVARYIIYLYMNALFIEF